MEKGVLCEWLLTASNLAGTKSQNNQFLGQKIPPQNQLWLRFPTRKSNQIYSQYFHKLQGTSFPFQNTSKQQQYIKKTIQYFSSSEKCSKSKQKGMKSIIFGWFERHKWLKARPRINNTVFGFLTSSRSQIHLEINDKKHHAKSSTMIACATATAFFGLFSDCLLRMERLKTDCVSLTEMQSIPCDWEEFPTHGCYDII